MSSCMCPEGFPACVSLGGRGLRADVTWQNPVGFLESSCRTTSKRCSDAKNSHLRSVLLFITQFTYNENISRHLSRPPQTLGTTPHGHC